jgi:hypothetical protein
MAAKSTSLGYNWPIGQRIDHQPSLDAARCHWQCDKAPFSMPPRVCHLALLSAASWSLVTYLPTCHLHGDLDALVPQHTDPVHRRRHQQRHLQDRQQTQHREGRSCQPYAGADKPSPYKTTRGTLLTAHTARHRGAMPVLYMQAHTSHRRHDRQGSRGICHHHRRAALDGPHGLVGRSSALEQAWFALSVPACLPVTDPVVALAVPEGHVP